MPPYRRHTIPHASAQPDHTCPPPLHLYIDPPPRLHRTNNNHPPLPARISTPRTMPLSPPQPPHTPLLPHLRSADSSTTVAEAGSPAAA